MALRSADIVAVRRFKSASDLTTGQREHAPKAAERDQGTNRKRLPGGNAPTRLTIMKSVFRLAARRTGLSEGAPQSRAAPVSEKRIGLTRRHLSRGDLHAMQTRALWN